VKLQAEGISFSIDGTTLLRDVSLAVEPGSLLGLVGPNGAGKTTLLRVLCGDLSPTSGVASLDGQPLSAYSLRALAQRRALMPQSTQLAFPFTGFEVVLMGRHPHLDRQGENLNDHRVADQAMARTETVGFRDRAYPSLSGGEQARINMARVLAQETPVVLLDEPTAHLDPRHQHLVLRTARELATAGASVLAVLHDLNLAATYADRVTVLAGGRVHTTGTPWDALTEEVLEEVFGLPFRRLHHPELATPILVPLPGISVAGQPEVPVTSATEDGK